MEIPFTYGKIVDGNDFTDRTRETGILIDNFLSQTNTAIISPRRWGKSSLVNKAIEEARLRTPDMMFVKMNVFKCESEQDFYALFAKRVVECVSGSAENLLANAREFISRLLPRLSISDPAGQYEISLGVDFKTSPVDEDILDLPQRIASKKGCKIVVCIDEFQQIGEFSDARRLQKVLRSHWQEQTDVAYILYGSKKHMMMHIFGDYTSPFYRFGDLMFLPKISEEDWIAYITRRFAESGKHISDPVACRIAATVACHSYYVQQLAQYAWLRTEKECSDEIVEQAFLALLDSLGLQFVNLMDSLTEKQRSFLCAISDGVKNLTSTDTLSRYSLGTSANIRILKAALQKRDLIEITGKDIRIQDPVFDCWIQRVYKTY